MTTRTYWNNHGRYQKTYDKLWADLVPDQGHCQTVEGEALRALSHLYYRFYNDGDVVDYDLDERDLNSVTLAHRFLRRVLPDELQPLLVASGDYERTLEELVNAVIRWIKGKKGQLTPNSTSLDYLRSRRSRY